MPTNDETAVALMRQVLLDRLDAMTERELEAAEDALYSARWARAHRYDLDYWRAQDQIADALFPRKEPE